MDRHTILNKVSNSEEKVALAQVLDKVVICEKNHEKTFSDFLDPAKLSKFSEILLKEQLNIQVLHYGGAVECERKMLGVAPSYSRFEFTDFPIELLEITYSPKAYLGASTKKLSHRDFLGAIMGMGISRNRIGDIIVNEYSAFLFLSSELSGYVCTNLERVASIKVEVKKAINAEIESKTLDELRLTVTSLRLDNIISAAFHISRSKSAGFVDGEKVFINWTIVKNASKQVSEGDMITVRGLGRVHFIKLIGKSKKDKFVILVGKSH